MSEINEILDIFFSYPLGKFAVISIAIILLLNAVSIIDLLPFFLFYDDNGKDKKWLGFYFGSL